MFKFNPEGKVTLSVRIPPIKVSKMKNLSIVMKLKGQQSAHELLKRNIFIQSYFSSSFILFNLLKPCICICEHHILGYFISISA